VVRKFDVTLGTVAKLPRQVYLSSRIRLSPATLSEMRLQDRGASR